MTDEPKPASYSGWAILELMGHVRIAGLVREEEHFGLALIRIDVPGETPDAPMTTQFYGPAALYCMTPTTEEIARKVAESSRRPPVNAWELSTRALPAPSCAGLSADDDYDPDMDPDDD